MKECKIKNLAMILARGGSKRIPHKNIRDFLGKPIIAYPIEIALHSGCFDEVMVSTDDDEIARIAMDYGAKIPFMRSPEAADDYATTDMAIGDVLDSYERLGIEVERFCCIYPTTPLLSEGNMIESMRLLDVCGSVMPVVEYDYPPMRSLIISENYLKWLHPECATMRSQDIQKQYHDAGQFYACRVNSYRINNTTETEDMVPIVLSRMEVQDIDSYEDWYMAELKYKMLKER